VAIPLRHLAVTGQTQESGKTTTLEALATRAGVAVLAFVTKRGEKAFSLGARVAPYFRDRADWQFVDQLISAQLSEKNKWLRQWFIPICRTTRTLADVQRAVRKGMEKATGQRAGAYVQLDAYLDLIVPEIQSAKLASSLELGPGLNVMDISGSSTPMQMLFVQSAIDWVNAQARNTVVVVPEAWEFVPEGKGSPAKASAIALVRKGGGIGNHIWVDSQDMAGVDKTILRGCAVWLIGVQREANEIKRNLANIPAGIKRPSAADVATLARGQFYACWGQHALKVYVQPAWLATEQARAFARSEPPPTPPSSDQVGRFMERGLAAQHAVDREIAAARRKEDPSMCEEHQRLSREMEALTGSLKEAQRALVAAGAEAGRLRIRAQAADELAAAIAKLLPTGEGLTAAAASVDEDAIVRKVLARIPAGPAGPLQVTPPAKLRADFQREEVARILSAIRDLSPLQKRILKLLEGLEGQRCFQKNIAQRLGRPTGGDSWIHMTTAVKGLASAGFVDVDEKRGVRTSVRDKIAGGLQTYQAADADVEAVYQNVLFEIANENGGQA
jgi:hypothetical protein